MFLFQKQVPIPLSCVRMVVDFLIHDNIDIRKVKPTKKTQVEIRSLRS